MSIIYEPRGKAREYSPLAANLYRGCSHGCLYCYAPAATFTQREKFVNDISARVNVLAQLEKDCRKYAGDQRNVLLSFTSDPYQPFAVASGITRKALIMMTEHNINVTVLTKGGLRAINDFDVLAASAKNEFAVTLTCKDDDMSMKWEPGAALPSERVQSLKIAKKAGLRTWVSFEPTLSPDDVYFFIDEIKEFVDLCKIGKLNYHKHANSINWPEYRDKSIELCEKYGIDYLIKDDLAAMK